MPVVNELMIDGANVLTSIVPLDQRALFDVVAVQNTIHIRFFSKSTKPGHVADYLDLPTRESTDW